MILAEDILNEMKRSLVNKKSLQIEDFSNFVDFKGDRLEMFYTFLGCFNNIKAKIENGRMKIEAIPVDMDIDEITLKRANANIWNYDQRRKILNPEAQILDNFLNEEYEEEEQTECCELDVQKKTLIENAKEFLDNKFEISNKECYLMLAKEFTDVNISGKIIEKIALVAQQMDFVFIVPIFNDKTDELEKVRFLMGFEKRAK